MPIANLHRPVGELTLAELLGALAEVVRPTVPPAGPASEAGPRHSPDWSTVVWRGKTYALTPKQRHAVAILWQAWEDGTPHVSGSYILERIETDQRKLSAVFRGSPAWRELIVPGEMAGGPTGSYCLAFAAGREVEAGIDP